MTAIALALLAAAALAFVLVQADTSWSS